MEQREDLKSILPYLPVVLRSSNIFWPPQVVEALKALSGGPKLSNVDSGELLFLAISDIRNSLGLGSHRLAYSAANGYALFFDDLFSRAEAAKWFGEVVPELAKLLLQLPLLLESHYANADETGLQLLDSQDAGVVILSQVISDHLVNVDDNRKIANSRWSSLPDDILTMIKDKLDIFDNASVNCACRNWWFASKNYPERHTVGDKIPWILQPSVNATTFEVISIPRKRKIILGVPEFCRGDILFSKQGWLLICLKKISQSSKRLYHYLFLLNPITRAIVNLPKIVITSPGEYENDTKILPASFSICNGRPHFVVLYECDYDRAFSLSVTRVGDKMWRNHSYKCQSDIYVELLIAILVIDQDIYCCYLCGEMIVYNVNSQVWKEVAERPKNPFEWYQARNYYIEYDEQVVKYRDRDGPLSEGEGLCRFNNSDHTWRELSDDFRNKNIDFDRVLRSFMFARSDCFLESTCLSMSAGNSSDGDDEDDDVCTELPFLPQMLRRKNIVPFPIDDTMILVDIG